jgi:hypothetical protein
MIGFLLAAYEGNESKKGKSAGGREFDSGIERMLLLTIEEDEVEAVFERLQSGGYSLSRWWIIHPSLPLA